MNAKQRNKKLRRIQQWKDNQNMRKINTFSSKFPVEIITNILGYIEQPRQLFGPIIYSDLIDHIKRRHDDIILQRKTHFIRKITNTHYSDILCIGRKIARYSLYTNNANVRFTVNEFYKYNNMFMCGGLTPARHEWWMENCKFWLVEHLMKLSTQNFTTITLQIIDSFYS